MDNLDGRPSRSLPPQISQKSNHEDAVWSDQPSLRPSIEEDWSGGGVSQVQQPADRPPLHLFLQRDWLRWLSTCRSLASVRPWPPLPWLRCIPARAMAPDSSRNFGEHDFVSSHKPWSLKSSYFVKKMKFCLALGPHFSV